MQHVHGAFKAKCVNRAIGVALIVLDDFQNTGPLALPGLAAGCLPPNWATLSAEPMASLTASGNSRRSCLEDPTQYSGFSPGASLGLITVSYF